MKKSLTPFISVHTVVLALLLAISPLAAELSPPAYAQLSDTTFNDPDWLSAIIPVYSSPTAVCGIPNSNPPCSCGKTSATGFPTSPSRQTCMYFDYVFPLNPAWVPPSIWVAHLYRSGTVFYNPSTQGAIAGLRFSYDISPPNVSALYGLLLFQNGVYFRSNPADTSADLTGTIPPPPWKSISRGFAPAPLLTPMDFVAVDNSGADTRRPDFSCKGGPITFGYVTGNSSGNHYSQSYLDNWHVDIVPGDPCCLKVVNETVACGSGGYTYSAQLQNPTNFAINQILVIPVTPAGVTVTPQILPVTLSSLGSVTAQIALAGASPGSTVTLRLEPYSVNGLCCATERQITMPTQSQCRVRKQRRKKGGARS